MINVSLKKQNQTRNTLSGIPRFCRKSPAAPDKIKAAEELKSSTREIFLRGVKNLSLPQFVRMNSVLAHKRIEIVSVEKSLP